jgi:hypothetical protein
MAFKTVDVAGLVGESYGLEVRLPDEDSDLSQDQEWLEVRLDGRWRRFRFHDYHELYNVPGLYETIFQRTLATNSPSRVVSLLQEILSETDWTAKDLRVLDVGAGNGMVGYELQNIGVGFVAGVDIIAEAKSATLRDRPWCYDDYQVVDLTAVPEPVEEQLLQHRMNTVTCVAALGFNDIPAAAFLKAIDLIESPGWAAFNIKEDFVQERDTSGFALLLKELARTGVLQMQAYRRYRHRYSSAGKPLHYIAMVARKNREVPEQIRRSFL